MIHKNKKLFGLVTIAYFLLPFINIYFAFLAIFCMGIPFYLLFKNNKNTWCSGICPRADYLSFFRIFSLGKKAPDWLLGEKFKRNLLMYFCMNIMFITLSSFMVYSGNLAAIDKIRLFIAFQLPWNMPQLVTLTFDSPLLLHLAFRFYSLMLSSTILGSILATVYKPRTWCVVCPVKTLSTAYLNRTDKSKEVQSG